MIWKFTSKKGRERLAKRIAVAKENLRKLKQAFMERNVIETIYAKSMIAYYLARIVVLEEGRIPVGGFFTIQHGVWHQDEKGPLVVNGQRGYYHQVLICKDKDNLLTNGGRDFFHYQDYTATSTGTPSSSSVATRGGGVIALSSDTTAPAATDTSVASEITTGGLARADASTKTHTVGTNVTTLQNVFTASSVQTAVQKSGLFNVTTAPVSGVLTHENTFTSVTLQINDTLTVTWTLTLG